MIRLITVLLTLIFSALAICFDFVVGSTFLDEFMVGPSLLLMGTILAVYMAVSSAFLAVLYTYEDKKEKSIFNKVISESQSNLRFIFILFSVHFLLASITPPPDIDNHVIITTLLFLKVWAFSLYMYVIYELGMVFLSLRDTFSKFS